MNAGILAYVKTAPTQKQAPATTDESNQWERVFVGVSRMKVPGGWLYRDTSFHFVPDSK